MLSLAAFALLDALAARRRRPCARPAARRPGANAALAVAILLPPTLAIGATFPFAVRVLARGARDAGPASARVYAWNTIGAIVGALGAGFFADPGPRLRRHPRRGVRS